MKKGFELSLLKKLLGNESFAICTSSVKVSLLAILLGSNKETEEQLEKVLNIKKDEDEIKKIITNIDQTEFKQINCFFYDKNLNIDKQYLYNLSNCLFIVEDKDFKNNSENERKNINKYIAKITNDTITELLEEKTIDSLTKVLISNTTVFKSKWKGRKSFSDSGKFTTLEGKTFNVEYFAFNPGKYLYSENDKRKILGLEYEDGSVIYFVQPQTEIENVIDDLNENLIFEKISDSFVDSVKIPKFVLKNKFSLKESLEKLGCVDAFNDGADLTGMSDEELYVSDIINQTIISVDKKGTEMKSSTMGILESKSIRKNIFILDKTFLAIIYNKKIKQIMCCCYVKDESCLTIIE